MWPKQGGCGYITTECDTDCALKAGANVSGYGEMFCIYFQTDALTTDLINKCHYMNLTFLCKVLFQVYVLWGTWQEERCGGSVHVQISFYFHFSLVGNLG